MLIKIDARHLSCPLPLLKAKQVMRKYAPVCTVEVITLDTSAPRDFAVYAEHADLNLVCEHAGPLITLTLSARKA